MQLELILKYFELILRQFEPFFERVLKEPILKELKFFKTILKQFRNSMRHFSK